MAFQSCDLGSEDGGALSIMSRRSLGRLGVWSGECLSWMLRALVFTSRFKATKSVMLAWLGLIIGAEMAAVEGGGRGSVAVRKVGLLNNKYIYCPSWLSRALGNVSLVCTSHSNLALCGVL